MISEDVFALALNAAVAKARACGVLVEVRGETYEDAYRYGAETSDHWPVFYGSLYSLAAGTHPLTRFHPDDIVILTPAACEALARTQKAPSA